MTRFQRDEIRILKVACCYIAHFTQNPKLTISWRKRPLSGSARPSGKIVLADYPVAADATCAQLMGYEPDRVIHLRGDSNAGTRNSLAMRLLHSLTTLEISSLLRGLLFMSFRRFEIFMHIDSIGSQIDLSRKDSVFGNNGRKQGLRVILSTPGRTVGSVRGTLFRGSRAGLLR